jgi:hypothetical protein
MLRRINAVTLLGAALLIACMVAITVAVARTAPQLERAKQARAAPYAVATSLRPRQPLINATAVAAGDSGRRIITVRNAGARPARIHTRKLAMRRSPLDPYLRISIYDATARRCVYPVPRRGSRPGRPCVQLAAWARVPQTMQLLPRSLRIAQPRTRQQAQWRPREQHRLVVSWQVAASAPNRAMGRRSTFTLRWTALR